MDFQLSTVSENAVRRAEGQPLWLPRTATRAAPTPAIFRAASISEFARCFEIWLRRRRLGVRRLDAAFAVAYEIAEELICRDSRRARGGLTTLLLQHNRRSMAA